MKYEIHWEVNMYQKNKRQIKGRWFGKKKKDNSNRLEYQPLNITDSSEASLGFCCNCLKINKTAGETGDYCISPTTPTQGKWKESIKCGILCNL